MYLSHLVRSISVIFDTHALATNILKRVHVLKQAKMKKISIILQTLLFLFLLNPVNGQEKIQYGSNNGNYILICNTRIYYEEYGKGIPLLLLHGGFGSIEYYSMVIPELSKHFRVIAIDSPGHGRSEQADSMSYQLIADYISEMIDVMRLDSVYVLGCSDGSIVALILAIDRPEKVKRIISDGGIVDADGYKQGVIEEMESITPETMSKSWVKEYKSKSPQKDQWEKFVIDTKKMWVDFPYIPYSKLGEIKSRTLIVMGDRDQSIRLEHGIKLYRAIKGSAFCVLPNLGHCICNKDPDLMNKIVIDFLTNK